MAKFYTPKDKAEALARLYLNNGDVPFTSAEVGIPAKTLRAWRDDPAIPRADVMRHLEAVMALHALRLAETLLDDNQKAPLNQRASALGMLFDRLLKLEARQTAPTPGTPAGPLHLTFVNRDGTPWEGSDDDELA